MADSQTSTVPRSPEEPTPEDVLDEMQICEPYTAGELEQTFDDASRWTIQRRLEDLEEQGDVEKKKHSANRVSWWVPSE